MDRRKKECEQRDRVPAKQCFPPPPPQPLERSPGGKQGWGYKCNNPQAERSLSRAFIELASPWHPSTYSPPQRLVVKNLPGIAGDERDTGSVPGLGRSPWRRTWQPSNILTWRIPMDRGAWRVMVHGLAQSWTPPKRLPEAQLLRDWWNEVFCTCLLLIVRDLILRILDEQTE